jgi:hypothetical protein
MWLSMDEVHYVREAVAKNARTPSDALDDMEFDNNYYVIKAVIAHPATRLTTLVAMARRRVDPNLFLQREHLPPELVNALVEHADSRGLGVIAAHPRVSKEILLSFQQRLDKESLRLVREKRSDVPHEMQMIAADISDCWDLVQDPHTSAEVLHAIAQRPNDHLRLNVLNHPNTSVETLLFLAGTEYIAKAILKRDELVPEVAAKIFELHPLLRGKLANHPQTPPKVLETIAEETDIDAVILAAKRISMPVHALQKLASHNNDGVRRTVAQNPSTPRSSLELLSRDHTRHVQSAAKIALLQRP